MVVVVAAVLYSPPSHKIKDIGTLYSLTHGPQRISYFILAILCVKMQINFLYILCLSIRMFVPLFFIVYLSVCLISYIIF